MENFSITHTFSLQRTLVCEEDLHTKLYQRIWIYQETLREIQETDCYQTLCNFHQLYSVAEIQESPGTNPDCFFVIITFYRLFFHKLYKR